MTSVDLLQPHTHGAMAALQRSVDLEREAQRSYWREHSSQPTVEAMMLDSKAAEIDQLERPEASTQQRPYCRRAAGTLAALARRCRITCVFNDTQSSAPPAPVLCAALRLCCSTAFSTTSTPHCCLQVLATLGSVAGKRVLELGAGIGRFTGQLARTGAHCLPCAALHCRHPSTLWFACPPLCVSWHPWCPV